MWTFSGPIHLGPKEHMPTRSWTVAAQRSTHCTHPSCPPQWGPVSRTETDSPPPPISREEWVDNDNIQCDAAVIRELCVSRDSYSGRKELDVFIEMLCIR